MAHQVADMVREYTHTTGNGLTLTLAGAVPGYVTFSSASNITNGTTVYYEIKNSSNIEIGVGTWNTGNLLSRTTPTFTLVDGVVDDTSPAKITLAGTSEVTISFTSKMFNDIFSTPSAIGSTTPAAGTFTVLTVNTSITYGGVTLSNSVTGTGSMVLSASPTFTGTPLSTTAAVDTNTTQIATTAFVIGQAYAKLASPTFTGTPSAPTAAAGTNTTQIATTAFVRTEYAAPPAIGNTTPAAGTFTTLTSNTNVVVSKTITPALTVGAQTINKTAGSVNFAAAATSLVVTNSLVDANSVIMATVATNDTTMLSVQAVAGSGSFTLYANAAATAETRVNFIVVN